MKRQEANFLSSLPKRSRRKGQFYIVTTIMIVAIIVGFASLSNFAQKRSSLKFFYEGEELELEVGKVIDYGISQDDSGSAAMIAVMDRFARDYIEYSGADNFYFVFGVQGPTPAIHDFRFLMYQKTDPKSVTLDFDSDTPPPIQEGNPGEITPYPDGIDYAYTTDWINLTIPDSEENLTFNFNMRLGSNFYYVITREIGGDRYLETNA